MIEDAEQLRAFCAARAFFHDRPVILALPGMSPAEAFTATERLNKDRGDCGCSLGAQAMTAGFVLTLAVLMIRYGPFTLTTLERAPIAFVVAVMCAGLGKAIGIATAHRRARRQVARILARFAAQHKE